MFLCSCASTTSAAGPGVALGFVDGLRDRAPFRRNRRRLQADWLSEQCLEGLERAIRGPYLEFGVPRRPDLQQRIGTAIATVEAGKMPSTDGIYGIRVTHNVDLTIAGFGLSK